MHLFKSLICEKDPVRFESNFAAYLTWLHSQMRWRCFRILRGTIPQGGLISANMQGGADISGRRKRNVCRHKDALACYEKSANAITQDGESCCKVPSKSRAGVTYDVVVDGTHCDRDHEVNSHCERCDVYSYQVSSLLPDAYQAGVSCVHTHVVATFVPEVYPGWNFSLRSSPTENLTIHQHLLKIIMQDKKREAQQYAEGEKLAQIAETMRILVREGQYSLVKKCGDQIDSALRLVPADLKERKPFRSALKIVQRSQGRYIDDDSDTDAEAHRILQTDREKLQTCFICGKRNPQEDGEDHVRWSSCLNQTVCKAWAHIFCSPGVDGLCSVCKIGFWQI
ncbi:hypothetical protein Aduo_001349 [Ancylostoma duodenale]